MIDNSKEYILCAAVKYVLLGKDIISLGYRHEDAKSNASKYYNSHILDVKDGFVNTFESLSKFRETAVEGFLTSKNRFVDRKEAIDIAFNSKQIHLVYLNRIGDELRSEDLY
jgi:hypothetical protein